MNGTLTREEFDKMLSTVPEPAFNEIWCSKKGLEKIKKWILVPGTSIYKKIDYLSFLVTPIRIREYIESNKLFLMKKTICKAPGTVLVERYILVQIIEILED